MLKQNLRLIHISCTMELVTIMALVLATLAIIILIQPILESDLQMLNLNLLLHMVPMDTLVLATTMGLPTLVFTCPMLTLDKQTASLPFHLDDIFSVLDDFDTKQENMSML